MIEPSIYSIMFGNEKRPLLSSFPEITKVEYEPNRRSESYAPRNLNQKLGTTMRKGTNEDQEVAVERN